MKKIGLKNFKKYMGVDFGKLTESTEKLPDLSFDLSADFPAASWTTATSTAAASQYTIDTDYENQKKLYESWRDAQVLLLQKEYQNGLINSIQYWQNGVELDAADVRSLLRFKNEMRSVYYEDEKMPDEIFIDISDEQTDEGFVP